MKKLLTLATALVAISACLPAPASAAAAATGTVKIQWNISAVATMVLEGNYNNAGAGGSDNLAPLTVPGGGTCNVSPGAGGAGNGTQALTLDFGGITPSASAPTVCVGLNAAEAQINTNDTSGVVVQEQLTAAPAQAGAAICGIAIKSNAPVAWAAAGVSSSNYTAAKATDTTDTTAANWSGATCAGLQYGGSGVNAQTVPGGAATTVFDTSDNTTNPAYFGEDYAVVLPANAGKTANDSGTVTYTVVTN